jgi:hypothetical protein
VRPGAYAQALAAAAKGITNPANDYTSIHSGAPGEENLWYQFISVQRAGYISPNAQFITLLESRSDPRRDEYFNARGTDLSATRGASTFSQPIVTAAENLLIWAEAAYRTGDQVTALDKLNAARAIAGLGPEAVAGSALLQEILTEKYIALFQSIEAWNDYKRTCFPNLTPVVTTKKIPARLYYGVSERQTNPNIPDPGSQPVRNANDPANATDPFGNACLGQ